MPRRKIGFVVLWLLTIGWTALLFGFSGQDAQESADLSTRLTLFIMRLLPRWEIGFDLLHHIVRKTAHFGIFAIEGMLLGASLLSVRVRAKYAACITLPACAILAALNEYHQSFAEGRYPSIVDVGIDFAGAAAGLAVLLAAAQLLRRKNAKDA